MYVYLYSDLESTWGRYVTESEPPKASWISTEPSSGFCFRSTWEEKNSFAKKTRTWNNVIIDTIFSIVIIVRIVTVAIIVSIKTAQKV